MARESGEEARSRMAGSAEGGRSAAAAPPSPKPPPTAGCPMVRKDVRRLSAGEDAEDETAE
jgi:hypothetical protein